MFTKKSLVSGVLATAMLLGVGSSVSAIQVDDGGGKKVKLETINLYIHGFNGDSDSLNSVVRYMTNSRESYTPKYYKDECTFKEKGSYKTIAIKSKYTYSGESGHIFATNVCSDFTYASFDFKPGNNGLKTVKDSDKRSGYKVIFPNNHRTLDNQIESLRLILDMEYFKNKRVNLIGHSMGGLAAVAYTAKYHPLDLNGNSKVNKIVTIASPLNGSLGGDALDTISTPRSLKIFSYFMNKDSLTNFAGDLKLGGDRVKKVQSSVKYIPKSVKIYSIAGASKAFTYKGNATDGLVGSDSALYLNKHKGALKLKASIKSSTFEGNHTSVMKNKSALKSIKSFLNN